MIDGLKPYPEYRESGVAWLGEVPAHWEIERAKTLFRRVERPVRPEHEVVTCFRDGTVTLRKNRRLSGFTESLKEIGYQGVRRGDLVIHAMDAFAGAVGVSDSDGKCTPVYAVCEPRGEEEPAYYAHVVREMARSQWIVALAKGIRERSTDFRFESFASQPVPVPPRAEQAAIVRFLDHADRRIRRYIRAKQKLIKLLEEQRQAIIRGCVSRGLDISAQLKPSGVEWLGTIPQHWAVRRLRFIAHIKTGERDTIQARADGAYPFFVRSQKVERIDSFSYDGEAVLTAGDGAGVAKVFHYVDGKFDYHQRVYKFSKFREVLGRFFFYYVQLFLGAEVLKLSAKSTVDSLRLPMLQNFPVVVPPPGEQRAIIASIEAGLGPRDTAIAAARRELSLVRELRTRLIADVVTGKLDVREAAAWLSEVFDEEPALDPLDEDATSLDGDDADAEALDPELQEA